MQTPKKTSFNFSLDGLELPDNDKARIRDAMQKTMLAELGKTDTKGDLVSRFTYHGTAGMFPRDEGIEK